MASADGPIPAEIEEIVSKIRASGALGERSRLAALLSFLVNEELEGRGALLKAYTIGTDVLGRSDDFDPSNDSIVRVEVNRLRRSLEHYSATNGHQDPYRIVIPKGSYRPVFEVNDASAPAMASAPNQPALSFFNTQPAAIVIGFALAGLIIAAAIVWRPVYDPIAVGAAVDQLNLEVAGGLTPPIINVEPFIDLTSQEDLEFVAPGLRMQIISDLSQMHIIRVRAVDGDHDGIAALNLRPPDYYLRGSVGRADDQLRITLLLINARNLQVVWSTVADVGVDDQSFEAHTIDSVADIVRLIAGPNGFIPLRQLQRLEERLAQGHQDQTDRMIGAHECHLRWHAYDDTKDQQQGQITRQCLNDLIAADTKDSAIWAAHGFMTFLEWSQGNENADGANPEQALAAVVKAIQLDPVHSEGHEYLASILMARGDHAGARESYRRAAKLNPSKPDLKVLHGWAHILSGDWETGTAMIRQGITLTPNPPGWFRIPLSMDAFRQADYRRAFLEAELIYLSGDRRGVPLALAPAIRLENDQDIARYKQALTNGGETAKQAIDAIRTVLNDPPLIEEYVSTLEMATHYN
ncbi:MAG: tetratricopeptide repeat protein [Pseudomonadota bacterium]